MLTEDILEKQLPNYTTERYYLISEIEQETDDIICLDEYSLNIIDNKLNDGRLIVVYILWKYCCGSEDLRNSLNNVTSHLKSQQKVLLVIETLLPEKGYWNESTKSNITNELLTIQTLYHFGCIVFGISDCAIGPALEAGLDCILEVKPEHKSSIILQRRSDLLGHDENLEPDAQSNVFQILLSKKNYSSWIDETFPRHKKINTSHSSTTRGGALQGVDVSRVISLLFIVISIIWFYFSN